ncbi:MAG: efflux RND transporter permease subunit, partial [Tannerellaceae bacterium]|nr:efflux RND transporter permease subunit [Tannerellaceae bacterium]
MKKSSNISSFTIIVAFLCVALVGVAFIPLLPVKLNPSRTQPRLHINFRMPNNSARVIEMEVTSYLEGMLSRVKGIKEISSTSGNGYGNITLELDKHTDIDAARFEASTIIRQVWPDLPAELSYPVLTMVTPDDTESRPFLTYTLNASATPIFIQRYAEEYIKNRLSSIPGIYRIDVSGATPMEWRLEYDNDQITSLGISISEIQNAISLFYEKVFLGIVKNRDESGEWIRVTLMSQIDEEGFNPALITVSNKEGKLIRLDQLLKVVRQEQSPQSYFRINGLNTIYLSIVADETANQLQLAKKIKDELQLVKEVLPPGYEIHTGHDATEYI